MNKTDLVERIAEATGLTKDKAREVLDAALEAVAEALAKGEKVRLMGFGVFEVRTRKPRVGVKPGTTERIEIPGGRYPAFKPSEALKKRVE